MRDLTGQVALVTGGSRGIGKAIALELARHGADVVVGYARQEAAAAEVVAAVESLGVRATMARAHLGDEDHITRLFEEVGRAFGHLDMLVNNAASGVNRPALEVTAHHWDWTLNVNARAAWLCAKQAVPLMEHRSGRIVNVSSLGSNRVMHDYFTVGVSKAALEAVTRYLAVELAPQGVRVNAVSGGLVETDALKSFAWGPQAIGAMAGRTPAGRLVEPADMARVVAFLCSEAAAMIRGQTIVVDGGFSLVI